MKTDRKVLLRVVAACIFLWSSAVLGPASGLASESPGERTAPTLPQSSDIWVSPTSLALSVWEGGATNQTLTIGNGGTDPLEWTLSVATGGTYLPGSWTLYYDWSCNGGASTELCTFLADHTFACRGSSGTWSQTDNQIAWTFPIGTHYSGYIAGNHMAGTMLGYDGGPGCWEAERVTTASVTLHTGERTVSGEPAGVPGVEIEVAVPDAEPVERVRPGEHLAPGTTAEGQPEMDRTTGLLAAQAPHRDLAPLLDVAAGGLVLWDLTHGVYGGYEPADRYSSLVSLLNGAGYTVDTTTAGLEHVSLWTYDVLVVTLGSSWNSAYTPAEVHAIELYVWNGGTLLVMAENPGCPNQHLAPIARAFGTTCGLADLSSPTTRFVRHATTAGVSEIRPVGGGALLASPPAQAVALDAGDRTGVSAARVGFGRIVVVGDCNLWDNVYIGEADNQLSAENVFHWLSASWLSATPAAGTVAPGSTGAVTAYAEDAYPVPAGEYGLLILHTNDPDEALVAVPVSVEPMAAPDLVTVPSYFDFVAFRGDIEQDVWLTYNLGSQALDWRLSTATGGTEIVGDWAVAFDWACNGSPGNALYTFSADSTFVEDYGGSGSWTQVDNRMAWTYGSGTQYTGFVAGDIMAGTMHDYLGYRGCWEAERVRIPTAIVHSGDRAPSGAPTEAPGNEIRYAVPDAAVEGRIMPGGEWQPSDPPGSVDSGTDLATGSSAVQAQHRELSPLLGTLPGGRVLWDLTHGVYMGYHPGNYFSSLAAMLASAGYSLDTTAAGVENLDLSDYDVLVVSIGSSWTSPYTPGEVAAIEAFANGGGGVMILCENDDCPNANVNPVAQALGITCGGSDVNGPMTDLASHSIFASVDQIDLALGGEVATATPAHPLAWDPGGKAVVAVAGAGSGKVVVVGDMNLWDNLGLAIPGNQLFAENAFHWLASWLSAAPASGITSGFFSVQDVVVSVGTARYRPGEAGLVILYSSDPDDALQVLPISLDIDYRGYLPVVLRP